MNPTLRTQFAHTSVRRFTDEPVSAEDRALILEATLRASTSCNLQLTSIIRVTDPELRKVMAVCSGHQAHVETAPEFWVFCADLHRNRLLCPDADLGWTEQFLTATLDTGIMVQNAMIALESLGLGGCFIGGLRNGVEEAARLLGLPPDTYPVLGLAFGHPAERNALKPRLPAAVTFMENRYKEPVEADLGAYDETMRAYYRERDSNARDASFRESVRPYLQKERRQFMLPFLQKQGFLLK